MTGTKYLYRKRTKIYFKPVLILYKRAIYKVFGAIEENVVDDKIEKIAG